MSILSAIGAFLLDHITGAVGLTLLGILWAWLKPKINSILPAIIAFINAHIESLLLRDFLSNMTSLVWTFVEREAALGVDAAKAASPDGKLSEATGKAAFDAVFADTVASLGPLWTKVSALIGAAGAGNLLSAAIEEAVNRRNQMKKTTDASAASVTPAQVVQNAVVLQPHLDTAQAISDLLKSTDPSVLGTSAGIKASENLHAVAEVASAELLRQLNQASGLVAKVGDPAEAPTPAVVPAAPAAPKDEPLELVEVK